MAPSARLLVQWLCSCLFSFELGMSVQVFFSLLGSSMYVIDHPAERLAPMPLLLLRVASSGFCSAAH